MMSCFSGSFSALPGVRCDRFDRLRGGGGMTPADQFFLSHCHTDHMVGLDDLGRFLRGKARQSPKINHKLYCSSISKAFVKDRFQIPDKAFVELAPNEPKTLHVFDTKEMYMLKVTGIGANHCPGSLMFLFEKIDSEGNLCKRILYTGDFRFDSNIPLTELRPLHDWMGNPLHLDEMYLDTTFCSEQYETFPTRNEAEERIWDQCDKWIKRNGIHRQRNRHVILLTLPAKYGYERILKYIYERSKYKRRVHVNPDKFADYLFMKELGDCAEPDPEQAPWIHACTAYKQKDKMSMSEAFRKTLPCQPGKEFEVCQIKPSAQHFTKERMAKMANAGDPVMSFTQGGNFYRICYSSHSSLTELKHFVMHFSPQKITPCAIPRNCDRSKVMHLLDNILGNLPIPPAINVNSASQNSSPLHKLSFSPMSSPTKKEESDDSLSWISFSPHKKSQPSTPDGSQDLRSCHSVSHGQQSTVSQEVGKTDTPIHESRVAFDEFMDMEERVNESSDEEGEKENSVSTWNKIEIIPGIINQDISEGMLSKPSVTITSGDSTTFSVTSRRRTFARSKVDQNYYSMPVQHDIDLEIPKERRSSVPSNMKLPVIKVTPSSPSPDPDDPDYPEFFQDRMYLQHVGKKPEDVVETCNEEVNRPDEGEGNQDLGSAEEKPISSDPPKPEPRRFKRQQSMFRDDEVCSTSFKKPKIARLGTSFDFGSQSEAKTEGDKEDEDRMDTAGMKSNKQLSIINQGAADSQPDNELKIQPRKRKLSIFQFGHEEPAPKNKILVKETQDLDPVDHVPQHETQAFFDDDTEIINIEDDDIKQTSANNKDTEPENTDTKEDKAKLDSTVRDTADDAKGSCEVIEINSSDDIDANNEEESDELVDCISEGVIQIGSSPLRASSPRNPTPDIEELIAEVEDKNYPEYVKVNLRKIASARDGISFE